MMPIIALNVIGGLNQNVQTPPVSFVLFGQINLTNEKQKEMFTDFKEERNKDKAISMEIRAELKKQSEATVRETNKDLGI